MRLRTPENMKTGTEDKLDPNKPKDISTPIVVANAKDNKPKDISNPNSQFAKKKPHHWTVGILSEQV